MKKKIKKKFRYPNKHPTPSDEKRTEPTVNTLKPIWGYSPTGRIICDELIGVREDEV